MSGSFYRAFEDRYRGSRDLIKDRLKTYLPFLEASKALGVDASCTATALDLGCGRGEFLELLGEAGFAARGVDLDEGMLAACRERGLDVVNDDAIGMLRRTPDDSLALVSAFHLIEHIPFDQVQELISQARRALRPGGLLILETPNPENLVVGTSSFYDDPSHLRPLPPKLLAFAVEFGGFARHGELRLQEDSRLHDRIPLRLYDVLAGASPDYSVVGQKDGPLDVVARFDALFATPSGIDLHALAERYQEQLSEFDARLAQASHGVMGLIERLDYHAHTVDARFAQIDAAPVQQGAIQPHLSPESSGRVDVLEERMPTPEHAPPRMQQPGSVDARLEALESGLGNLVAHLRETSGLQARVGALEEALGDLQATTDTLGHAIELGVADRDTMSERLTKLDAEHPGLIARVEEVEAAMQLQGQRAASRLRTRIAELEQTQKSSEHERNRLAQHVAWIEGRLTHAESEAATLRHLTDALLRRTPLRSRLARLGTRMRRLFAGAGVLQRLRQRTIALLRRVLLLVLRSPSLKRAARTLVARFPGLRARLLRVMYSSAANATDVEAPADPLTSQMSPRSLTIYRELTRATNDKD